MVFNNDFNTKNVREFLNISKPNSHTSNSDIERQNNTITEKIRTSNLENHLPIPQQIYKAFVLYNDTHYRAIKCTPLDV